MRTSVGDQHT